MPSRPVTIVTAPSWLAHRVGHHEPERPERWHAAMAAVEAFRRQHADAVRLVQGRVATRDELARAHSSAYLQRLDQLRGGHGEAGPEAPVAPGSIDAAERAAGAVLSGVEAALAGAARVFVAARPPGHHAEAGHGMGFCILSNVAIGALHAAETVGRVLVIDIDVHHGNGTQHITERDPRIGFVDIHQHPLYPGSGDPTERGSGAGSGTVWNLPVPPGSDGTTYLAALEKTIPEAFDQIAPRLVIVSLGFDAHQADPLGSMRLTARDLERILRLIGQHADASGGVPVVAVLEGGYDLGALHSGTRAALRALSAPDDEIERVERSR